MLRLYISYTSFSIITASRGMPLFRARGQAGFRILGYISWICERVKHSGPRGSHIAF
jgi:hypothetical protein